MIQSMGLKRARHGLGTKQQTTRIIVSPWPGFKGSDSLFSSSGLLGSCCLERPFYSKPAHNSPMSVPRASQFHFACQWMAPCGLLIRWRCEAWIHLCNSPGGFSASLKYPSPDHPCHPLIWNSFLLDTGVPVGIWVHPWAETHLFINRIWADLFHCTSLFMCFEKVAFVLQMAGLRRLCAVKTTVTFFGSEVLLNSGKCPLVLFAVLQLYT